MKKLPILLLTLTLAGMMPVEIATATGEELARERDVKTELPASQTYDPRFHIQAINPKTGTVEVEMDSPIGTEIRVKRIWIASFDYENGWTEAEVDARLENWKELKEEWTYVTKEQVLSNMALHSYATIPLNIDTSRLQYNLTVVNWPDILYYAAEFEDLKAPQAEPIWIRGKVDYRGCVHSKAFEEGLTERCVEKLDVEAGTVKYLAQDGAEEEVITWEEEWRRVLAGRLDEVGLTLDGLAMLPEVTDWDLDNQEMKLTKIDELLKKATGVEDEKMKSTELKERIVALRNRKTDDEEEKEAGGSSGGSGNDGNTTGGENDMTGDGNGTLGGTGGAGGADSPEAGSGSSGAEDDSLRGDSGVETKKPSGVGGGATEAGNRAIIQEAGALNNDEEKMLEESDEISRSEDVKTEPQGEVEVPKLGGAQARSGWIWWVLGISGVLSLFLVLVLKRKQSRDRQR